MKIRVTQINVWEFETDDYTIGQLRQDASEGGCMAIDMAREHDLKEYRETISQIKD